MWPCRSKFAAVRVFSICSDVALGTVWATAHIGYVAENLYRAFYEDVAANIAAWLDTQPTLNANSSRAG